MGEKYTALIDWRGPRDAEALDPAALDFTARPHGAGCRGCLFRGQWVAVCNKASELAARAGMKDCEDGVVYVLAVRDDRQLQIGE
jgi:hypothetical protein